MLTKQGQTSEDVLNEVEWKTVEAFINKKEKPFRQTVEFPTFWSQNTINIVSDKYFYGQLGSPEREYSLRQLINRVVNKIADEGKEFGYFAAEPHFEYKMHELINARESEYTIFKAELTYAILHQMFAFNSPVWFNIGTPNKQAVSACYITRVDDNLESIAENLVNEMMIFRDGSGNGTNVSRLRGSKEKITGGGHSSGPLSFMQIWDKGAGATKSGGKTRRAAKMILMDVDHPDIEEYITCKSREEQKARDLIDAGWDDTIGGESFMTVSFQNANHSIRVTDKFLNAVHNDANWDLINRTDGKVSKTIKARDLWNLIVKSAWETGDPGIQFDDVIQEWNTCKNDDRINATNPCLPYDSMICIEGHGSLPIGAACEAGLTNKVLGPDGEFHEHNGIVKTGEKETFLIKLKSGAQIRATANHPMLNADGEFVEVSDLKPGDTMIRPVDIKFGALETEHAELIGLAIGDGCIVHRESRSDLVISMSNIDEIDILNDIAKKYPGYSKSNGSRNITVQNNTARLTISKQEIIDNVRHWAILDQGSENKTLNPDAFQLNKKSIAELINGLFTADGTVQIDQNNKMFYIGLDSTSEILLRQIQYLLLGFGIRSNIYYNRRNYNTSLLPDTNRNLKEYQVKQYHSLRLVGQDTILFEKEIGFHPKSNKTIKLSELNKIRKTCRVQNSTDTISSIEPYGIETVYDVIDVKDVKSFIANGYGVSNCAEYVFLDWTSCNLGSLNLLKYVDYDVFNIKKFTHVVSLATIAMNILIDFADYPVQKIAEGTRKYRTIGIGYANLGSLLMNNLIPYDSNLGRDYASAITSLMTAASYLASAKVAAKRGPFPRFKANKESMLNVINMHFSAHEELCDIVGRDTLDKQLQHLLVVTTSLWDEVVDAGANGFANAQVTVLAPTGTIGIMMGCDTTGIEPLTDLVTYKSLIDGGVMKFIYDVAFVALIKLGYLPNKPLDVLQAETDLDKLFETIDLKHLPIFASAIPSTNKVPAISAEGHVKMLGAVAAFLSGSCSKTCNLPSDATEDDISRAYFLARDLGVKCVAVYRDGCKAVQPLSTKKEAKNPTEVSSKPADTKGMGCKLERQKLPNDRASITHKFDINGHDGYITVGLYPDGRPGEVFIIMNKGGSFANGMMDSLATSISLGLQYGVPISAYVNKFKNQKFEPSGFTANDDIRICTSTVDYLAKYLENKFVNTNIAEEKLYFATGTPPAIESTKPDKISGPPCRECGSIQVKRGTCWFCETCGETDGCG